MYCGIPNNTEVAAEIMIAKESLISLRVQNHSKLDLVECSPCRRLLITL